MAAKINYDDNLFFLKSTLKIMRQGIQLDIDPEFFLKKIVQDLLFQHDCLNKMYQSLVKNTLLLQRIEYLRTILLAKKEFIEFIDVIHTVDASFARELVPFLPQLTQCKNQHEQDIAEILIILDDRNPDEHDETDIISQDEYKFLFHPEEEETTI